eukprot:scaffold10139_cov80-Attheya_sp.AAC.6
MELLVTYGYNEQEWLTFLYPAAGVLEDGIVNVLGVTALKLLLSDCCFSSKALFSIKRTLA